MRKIALLSLTVLLLIPAVSYAQSVDLVWQGETYTHPFYEGRSLWGSQSSLVVQAIPNGLGNRANVNYKWTKDGVVLGNNSGVGRSTIFLSDSVFSRLQEVTVEIIGEGGNVLASRTEIINPIPVSVAVYENHPLYGLMFHREVLDNYQLTSREITFAAFPFFFSATNRLDPSIVYDWRTNTGDRSNQNSATYRTPDDAFGTSRIQLGVSSSIILMQRANRNFNVNFDNRTQR